KSAYGAYLEQVDAEESERKSAEKLYRHGNRKLSELFQKQKLVAFYLLDMGIDKFCTFFERSNSRGIQLNFTDILAAKLYHRFNLRKKIEEFEDGHSVPLLREVVIRAIMYICEERKTSVAIDKQAILRK